MSLEDVKTHSLLLLADVTNLLPAKGQYFNEKQYRKYFHHNFIIMLVFQGALSLIHQQITPASRCAGMGLIPLSLFLGGV